MHYFFGASSQSVGPFASYSAYPYGENVSLRFARFDVSRNLPNTVSLRRCVKFLDGSPGPNPGDPTRSAFQKKSCGAHKQGSEKAPHFPDGLHGPRSRSVSAALPPAINSATTRPLASARAAGTTRSRSTLLARKDEKRFLLLLTSAMSRRMPCSMLDAALFLRCSCSRASRTRHGSSDGRKREAYQAARKCELAKPMQPARGVKVSVQ